MLVMVPVEMLKVPLLAEAAMVTDGGTVRAELETARVTTIPPFGADWESEIVQVPEAFDATLVGLQDSEETLTGASRLTVALADVPL